MYQQTHPRKHKSMATKSKQQTPFDAFIKQRYSKKGEQHTHTRIGSEKLGISGGTYTVPSEDIGEFYRRYTDHVFLQGPQVNLAREAAPCVAREAASCAHPSSSVPLRATDA